jgi:mitotic spindle assembly checkpoint protein MAD2
MREWLLTCEVKKLVVVITDATTEEIKERWNFDIETDKQAAATGSDKPESEITAEIRHLIRQITSCVTFLPLLECPCTFDLLVYTDKESVTPTKWEESEAKYIANAEDVRLRSFTTKVKRFLFLCNSFRYTK